MDPLKNPIGLVSNRMVVEVEDRFVIPSKLGVGFPYKSWTTKTTCKETSPAKRVCAAVVKVS